MNQRSGPWGQVYRQAPPGTEARFLTMTESAASNLLAKSEKDFALVGLRSYHTYRSDRSEPGFPDRVWAGGSDLTWYAELKGYQPSRKSFGIPKPDQIDWMNRLAMNPNNVVRLLYPWQIPDFVHEMFTYCWEWGKQHGIR